jgi:hypothetical protein
MMDSWLHKEPKVGKCPNMGRPCFCTGACHTPPIVPDKEEYFKIFKKITDASEPKGDGK